MTAPVKRVAVVPQHPGRGQPSYIEVSVQIGESRHYNVGVLTPEDALALAEDALRAARTIMRVNTERSR